MILSATLLIAAAALQPAPDWRPLADNAEVIIAWNAAGVSRQGDLVLVPVRVTPRPPRTGANAYSIARIELRCAANQARVALTENYADDGTPGQRDTETLPFAAISEGTIFETLRNQACAPGR